MKNKIQQFGKDHWSLLAYVEFRVINHQGILNKVHLRIKNPVLANANPYPIPAHEWKKDWGTRLKGYWNKDGTTNPKLQKGNHDDLDCLDDLEEAGLVKSWGTGLNPAYKLTKFGIKVLGELTLWKQEGKNYSDFVTELKQEKENKEAIPPMSKDEGILARVL